MMLEKKKYYLFTTKMNDTILIIPDGNNQDL